MNMAEEQDKNKKDFTQMLEEIINDVFKDWEPAEEDKDEEEWILQDPAWHRLGLVLLCTHG